MQQEGPTSAGTHLLVDLWRAQHLDDVPQIETMLRDAASACGASLLELHVHHFGTGAGVTGVAVLAESHITIHTWPERGYAAIDVFMCGKCTPRDALPVFQRVLAPETLRLSEHERGATDA